MKGPCKRWLILTMLIALLFSCVGLSARAADSQVITAEDDGGSHEDLFMQFLENLFQEQTVGKPGGIRRLKKVVTVKLEPMAQVIYDLMKAHIVQVAAGEEGSAEFDLPLSELGFQEKYTADDLGLDASAQFSDGADKISEQLQQVAADLRMAHAALLLDLPYELYWYDKSAGLSWMLPGVGGTSNNGEWSWRIAGDITVRMSVIAAYSTDKTTGTTTTDQARIRAAIQAVANAHKIVEQYADKSDYEKLAGYRDEICALVAYDYDALASMGGSDFAYGDPWQLISVFDGDETTNVVCEGYAKAFRYLCDLTSFDGDISCYTVTGLMGDELDQERHMWNIVTMEDGKNYLVDVTNSDDGTVGSDGSLFLAGFDSGSPDVGYWFKAQEPILYVYDMGVDLYSEAELTISATHYQRIYTHWDIAGADHVLEEVAAVAPACEEEGCAAYWRCVACGKVFTDEKGVHETTLAALTLRATGHAVLTSISAVEPTCETEGLKAHLRCKACGKLFADVSLTRELTQQEVAIPALGHDYQQGACTRCGQACPHERTDIQINPRGTEIRPVDGRFHQQVEISVTVETCQVCGLVIGETEQVIPGDPADHAWQGGVCSVCGYACLHEELDEQITPTGADYFVQKDLNVHARYTPSRVVDMCLICGEVAAEADQDVLTGTEAHEWEGEECLLCHATRVIAPAKPTGVSATLSGRKAVISWKKSSRATSYSVYGGPKGSPALLKKGITGTSYTSANQAYGTVYQYYVVAVNEGGSSANSAKVSVTAMKAPASVAVTVSARKATVTWKKVTGATSYSVYGGKAGSLKLLKSGITTTSYKSANQTYGKAYEYYVVANNAGGSSANSATVSAIALKASASLTAASTSKGAVLTWKAVTGATGYEVLKDGKVIKKITKATTLT
ncbi:MAG: hypothetical protein IJ662_03575, partial [Clostridia bacterium]|nr:hypothetical protein [Clostridia bacterium]